MLPHVDKPAGTILSVDKKGIQIATKEGVLNLLQLQPAGKKPMSVQDFLNGRAVWFQVGKVLNELYFNAKKRKNRPHFRYALLLLK